jgi:hypothetical protein
MAFGQIHFVHLLLLDGFQLPSLPRTKHPGLFFATRFFQFFIKFLRALCFCTVGGTSDFLKIESWLRNSVHTMTPWHTPIGLGGGMVGVKSGELSTLSRGYGNDLWYTRCIDWGNSVGSVCLARLRGFFFWRFNHEHSVRSLHRRRR